MVAVKKRREDLTLLVQLAVAVEKEGRRVGRECHGYKKPAGKCHGLPWDMGTGSQNCTQEKSIPQPWVQWV